MFDRYSDSSWGTPRSRAGVHWSPTAEHATCMETLLIYAIQHGSHATDGLLNAWNACN
jgi:hypothetical protein